MKWKRIIGSPSPSCTGGELTDLQCNNKAFRLDMEKETFEF